MHAMINARHAWLALAAGAVALPLATTTPRAAAGLRGCASSDVTVSIGPPVSPMTGEHAVSLVVAARSAHRCTLDGYPAIRLRANARPLPFLYQRGGGPYVTTHRPAPVIVRGGHPANVLVAKYRCDAGDRLAATTLFVRLPAGRRWVRLHLGPGVQGLAYCRRAPGAPSIDPGNRVAVSPVEASFAATR